MPGKLLIAGASGKLGHATLQALLSHTLLPRESIICTSSSSSGAEKLSSLGVETRFADWDDAASWATALQGIEKLFLISSARVDKDFDDAPEGTGREADHFVALDAARKAGVEHVYYTSLAFANPSRSRVMKAHERTEAYLTRQDEVKWTIIREGLYSESWPLYLGHFDPAEDSRDEVVVAGEGRVNWTAINDLGLANALILAAESSEYAGKTLYLAQSKALTLSDVAELVAKTRGSPFTIKVVDRTDHEKHHTARGMDKAFVQWWSKTYDALAAGECEVPDHTLEELLATKGIEPTPMAETVNEMARSSQVFTGK